MSLVILLQQCFEAVLHGHFPSTDLLKQTISKVSRYPVLRHGAIHGR